MLSMNYKKYLDRNLKKCLIDFLTHPDPLRDLVFLGLAGKARLALGLLFDIAAAEKPG